MPNAATTDEPKHPKVATGQTSAPVATPGSYPTPKETFKVKKVPVETFQKEAAIERAKSLPEPVLLGTAGEDRKKEKEILVDLEAHKDHKDRDADVTALKAKPEGNNTRAGDNKVAQVKANPELANKNRTVTVIEDIVDKPAK